MGVPVVATEQNAERMGGTEADLADLLRNNGCAIESKMTFSCCRTTVLESHLSGFDRRQIILAGIETHICVLQTAMQLVGRDAEVCIVGDAVSARSEQAHSLGIERMRQAGVVIAHSESIAYEWMGSADHPSFRDVLGVVKRFADMDP
jgi:nicotinamidase-related amidase